MTDIDLETVISIPTIRVGYLPPRWESLTAGELYIQTPVEAGAVPCIWVGTPAPAGFPGNAASLIPLGLTLEPPPPPVAEVPPVNVDVPYVAQDGAALACTMGNWEGEPTSYAYQWQLDGQPVGVGTDTYAVTAEDVGKTATCIVSATNDFGTTAAPPSIAVVVADPVARSVEEEAVPKSDHRRHRGK